MLFEINLARTSEAGTPVICCVLTQDIAGGYSYTFATKKKSTGSHCGTVYMAPVLAKVPVAKARYGDIMKREGGNTEAL